MIVGQNVTVEVGGRRRPGTIVGEGPTYFEIACTDGEQPSGYRIPRHALDARRPVEGSR